MTHRKSEMRESQIKHLSYEKQEDVRIVVRLVSTLCPTIETIILEDNSCGKSFTFLALSNGNIPNFLQEKLVKSMLGMGREFSLLTTPMVLELRDLQRDSAEVKSTAGFVHRILAGGLQVFDREIKIIDYL